MKQLVFAFAYPPSGVSGNHAVRHAKGRHYLSEAAKNYRALINMQLAQQCGKLHLAGPLQAEWVLAPPDNRARDIDNVRKSLADALTHAGLWEDDSNKVIKSEIFKWQPKKDGGLVMLYLTCLG